MHNAILFDILLEQLLYMYMNEIVHDMILAWFPTAFHCLPYRKVERAYIVSFLT